MNLIHALDFHYIPFILALHLYGILIAKRKPKLDMTTHAQYLYLDFHLLSSDLHILNLFHFFAGKHCN